MHEAAKELRFEYAARLRDEVNELKTGIEGDHPGGQLNQRLVSESKDCLGALAQGHHEPAAAPP